MEAIQILRPRARREEPERGDCADARDGDLLERFVERRDESAFAELVRRHGPMVLGVCRRVLGNAHDADDCFQAAFMVLVRRAEAIQPPSMVGNWLYGVAYRTALEARKMAARRRIVERKQPPAQGKDEVSEDRWGDLRPVLDLELSKLPDKYRVVVVACDLQGQTRQQAARQLGLPEGTIASRLARGRALLAKRLQRHQVALSALTLGATLANCAAAESVPPALTRSTLSAAARLAAGKPCPGKIAELADRVVKAMGVSRWQIAGAVLALLVLFGVGISLFAPGSAAERGPVAVKAKPVLVFSYVLQNVDPAKGTIEARGPESADGQDAPLLCLRVERGAAILIDGRDAKLAELQAGYVIDLLFERTPTGEDRALRIEATGVSVGGLVLARDDDSLTLESDLHGEKINKQFALEKDAVTYIDGKQVKFAQLKKKMKVTVHLPFSKPGMVKKIEAAGPKKVGMLKAIDPDGPAVAIVADDPPAAAEDVRLAGDAPVLVDGKKSEVRLLRPGMHVTLRMSADADRACAIGLHAITGKKED